MIFEMRTYLMKPGSIPEVEKRFAVGRETARRGLDELVGRGDLDATPPAERRRGHEVRYWGVGSR